MGILRTDRVSGLGGANAIKGSVEMRGAQNLRAEVVNGNADFNLGSSDYTVECWLYRGGTTGTANSLDQDFVMLWNNTNNRRSWGLFYDSGGSLGLIGSSDGSNSDMGSFHSYTFPDNNAWYHIAAVRISNTVTVYVNGTSIGSATVSGSYYENTVDNLVVGGQLSGTNYDSKIVQGFLSNVRIIIGDGIYTGAFTPPTNELTVTANTKLLCCQSSGNILQEATGKTLIAYRSSSDNSFPLASTFTPNSPVGFSTTTDVGTQFGSTFDGVTTFDSQAYMVPPGGNTRERNRGRGLFGGGYTTVPGAAALNTIYYVEIQSMGNSVDFGDLNKAACWGGSMCASSTRGLHAGGTSPTNLDSIDFVTIANTGNAKDFGNLTSGRGYTSAASNQTRGLVGGGRGGSPVAPLDSIDLVTIATLGNASDFGDLSNVRMGGGALASPTRALFIGGTNSPATPSAYYASIDRVEIATAGDASDFGDLSAGTRHYMGCASSTTRGLIGGGSINPARVNTIEFVTIASDGNSSDFGDLLDDREHPGATSNGIRAIWAGGVSPYRNSIEFVTIATTGNAQDFGDIADQTSYAYASGTSDSHGGVA